MDQNSKLALITDNYLHYLEDWWLFKPCGNCQSSPLDADETDLHIQGIQSLFVWGQTVRGRRQVWEEGYHFFFFLFEHICWLQWWESPSLPHLTVLRSSQWHEICVETKIRWDARLTCGVEAKWVLCRTLCHMPPLFFAHLHLTSWSTSECWPRCWNQWNRALSFPLSLPGMFSVQRTLFWRRRGHFRVRLGTRQFSTIGDRLRKFFFATAPFVDLALSHAWCNQFSS